MNKRIDWNKILNEVKNLQEILIDQNFMIDLAYRFYALMSPNLTHRPDINSKVISAYWAREFLEHNKLNSYPLNPQTLFIDINYYSYLNLDELKNTSFSLGEPLYIIDLISETTDIKVGMEIDDWFDDNDYFKSSMQYLWETDILQTWIVENKLMAKKTTTNYSNYWNYEDYIYQMRIFDYSGKPKLVILLGTYLDYN